MWGSGQCQHGRALCNGEERGRANLVLVEGPSKAVDEAPCCHRAERGSLATMARMVDPLSQLWVLTTTVRGKNWLGWGIVHNDGVQWLLRVVDHGRRIIECIVKEALQVEVTHGLDQILKELIAKKKLKTRKGGGEGGKYVKIGIHSTHNYIKWRKLFQISLLYLAWAYSVCTCNSWHPCIYHLLDYSIQIGGRGAHFLLAHESTSQGPSKTNLGPTCQTTWGALCSWRWNSRCSWRGCHPPWGCCHGLAANHRDTLSWRGVGP